MDEIRKLKEIWGESARKGVDAWREAEALFDSIERDPAEKKAEALRADLEAERSAAVERDAALAAQKAENSGLRAALLEQTVDEKMGIIKSSRERTRAYFHENGDIDAIGDIESSSRRRLDELKAKLTREAEDESRPLLSEIAALEEKARALIEAKRERLRAAEADLSGAFAGAYQDLEKRPLDEETIQRRIKRNRWELKIGASWLGRIGIVLIIIAAGLFAYYARDLISPYAKGALIFIGGLALLGIGELLYRKRKPPFHKIFLGGGIALLYIAIFAGHFFLKAGGKPIMGFGLALGFAVATAVLALVLSIRYSSRTILALAAIGGHLPFAVFLFAYGFSGAQYYYAMAYLLTLDALLLGVGILKDWPIASYLLFFLGCPSIAYLAMGSPAAGAGLAYLCVDLAVFMAASFSGPLLRKRDFRIADLALLGLKTAIAAVLAYLLFPKMGLADYDGVITIGLCLCFLGAAYLSSRIGTRDRKPMVLFLITALTFAVLVIPFQFGAIWLSLGWLVEATLLIAAGYAYGKKPVRIAGWSIFALCAATFAFADLPIRLCSLANLDLSGGFSGFNVFLFDRIPLFDLKYLAMTAALSFLAAFFGREQKLSRLSTYGMAGTFHKGFRYAAIANLFLFVCLIAPSWYKIAVDAIDPPSWAFPESVSAFARIAVVSVGLRLSSLAATRSRWLMDATVPKLGAAFIVAADILAVFIVFTPDRLALADSYSAVTKVLAFIALTALLALAILDLRRFLILRFRKKGAGLEFYPLIMAISIAAAGSAVIIFQMGGIGIQRGLTVSLYYLAVAVGAIAYGFAKRFSYVRFAGLGLIGVAMLVLLVNALFAADTVGRIIAFLVFGAALIAMSAAYASISKRIGKAAKKDASDE